MLLDDDSFHDIPFRDVTDIRQSDRNVVSSQTLRDCLERAESVSLQHDAFQICGDFDSLNLFRNGFDILLKSVFRWHYINWCSSEGVLKVGCCNLYSSSGWDLFYRGKSVSRVSDFIEGFRQEGSPNLSHDGFFLTAHDNCVTFFKHTVVDYGVYGHPKPCFFLHLQHGSFRRAFCYL